ncbi:MAG: DUF4340 domain-containing protein [Bacteroidota bacterium]
MKKNYIILVAILALLLLSAYLVMQKQGEQSSTAEQTAKFISVDSLSIDKISIRTSSQSLLLEKQGNTWHLKEPINDKADQPSVAKIIHMMKELEIKNVVSSNPAKQSVFNVDTVNGTRVTLFENGNETSSFIVGKSGPSYNDTYVRKHGSNDVLLVNASLGYEFTKGVKEWRNKILVSVPRETIKEVTYQFGDTTFSVTNSGGAWLIGKDTAQSDVVNGVLAALTDLRADDFLDTVHAAAKKVQTLVSYANTQVRFALDKTTNKYFVQTSASPQWYVMEQWRVNQVLKRKKEFVKK